MAYPAVLLAIIGQALKSAGAVGAGVSDLFGAYGVASPEDEARLAELKGLKESGSLGLSSDAMKALQLQALAPQQAAQREGQQKMAAAYGAAGASPADLARMQQGLSQRTAENLQPAMGALAAAQELERKTQEEQLLDLGRKAEDEKRAKQQAWTKIVASLLGASSDTMQSAQTARGQQEEVQAGEESTDSQQAAEAWELISQFMS